MKKQNTVSHGPSQRQLRVGELVRHVVADMVMRGDIIDDAIKGQLNAALKEFGEHFAQTAAAAGARA